MLSAFSTLFFHAIYEFSSHLITLCPVLPSGSSTRSLPLQFNLTNLDWNQLSKKDCVKYGGSLVGPSCKYVPDLALMSFILFFGTYSMTVSLKKFKFSRYFPTKVRWQEISNTYFLPCNSFLPVMLYPVAFPSLKQSEPACFMFVNIKT